MVCSARPLVSHMFVCCFWLYDLNQIDITKKQVICIWHFLFLPELISNCASVICLGHLKLAFSVICLMEMENASVQKKICQELTKALSHVSSDNCKNIDNTLNRQSYNRNSCSLSKRGIE